jgi:hypothetical protein
MNRRPKLSVVAPGASPEEAAAVAAAIEQFMRATAPAVAAAAPVVDRWLQVALQEGVRREPELAPPWA